jgi:hypothetical protein
MAKTSAWRAGFGFLFGVTKGLILYHILTYILLRVELPT